MRPALPLAYFLPLTFLMMTEDNRAKLQYSYDSITAHMLTQGRKSLSLLCEGSPLPSCAYRGEDGDRCGVGFCIPNHKYTKALEGIGLDMVFGSLDYMVQTVLDAVGDDYCNDREFLADVQHIHDCTPVDLWLVALTRLGEKLGLDTSIVDTFSVITIAQPQELVYEAIQRAHTI